MKETQKKIQQFCQEHGLATSVEHTTLDLVSEVGEVAKEVLKGSDYGSKTYTQTQDIESELGDALYSLITVANLAHVDLEKALDGVLEKYKNRFEEKGSVDSGN